MALLLIVGTGVGAVAISATPSEGTITLENRQATWTGQASGHVTLTGEPQGECNAGTAECDEYELNVDVDPNHWDENAGGAEVRIAWEDPANDFNLYAYRGAEKIAQSSQEDTTVERVFIPNANRDDGPYTILVTSENNPANTSYGGGARLESRPAAEPVPTEPLSGVKCTNGMAGPFPCSNVDLEAFLPVSELGGTQPAPPGTTPTIADLVNDNLNDIWGWTDPQTKREYAIVGKTDGTAFVDVTDPRKPVYRGQILSRQNAANIAPVETIFKNWRDIKVYKDHAFIGSEEPTHGLQVFDLRRLRGETPSSGRWTEDAGYDGFGNSHNIVINEESGFLYAVGTNTCGNGGPHIVDIRDPQDPKEAGCIEEDGYTHDAQCVIYDGPDQRFVGKEICFNANEDTVTIVDVTNKAEPKQLARLPYDGAAYTHQGWLTKDGSRFIVNDEADETDASVPTTSYVFNVEKLDAPAFVDKYQAKVASIDHNLYVKEDTVYEANYRSGLRILDGRQARAGKLSEVGFFDVYPADDAAEFNGAWSNYPYFPSGTVVVSGIEQGLFVLRPRDAAGGLDGRLDNKPASDGGSSSGAASQGGAAQAAGSGSRATTPVRCTPNAGFASVGIQRYGGRGLELEFNRRVNRPVTVDVFQQSIGRRIVGERLVARFSGLADDVRWNGKANRKGRRITDGYYFARYRVATPQGVDTRRIAMRRVRGKWSRRPDFYRRAACDLLRSFKLERPVFGGRTNRALNISFQADRSASATVRVLRGGRTVRSFTRRGVAARRTIRLRAGASKLPRGNYLVQITLTRRGERAVTSTLAARRL